MVRWPVFVWKIKRNIGLTCCVTMLTSEMSSWRCRFGRNSYWCPVMLRWCNDWVVHHTLVQEKCGRRTERPSLGDYYLAPIIRLSKSNQRAPVLLFFYSGPRLFSLLKLQDHSLSAFNRHPRPHLPLQRLTLPNHLNQLPDITLQTSDRRISRPSDFPSSFFDFTPHLIPVTDEPLD